MIGLARGGVPVAYEVAQALGAPLDVLAVRKIGAPGNPESAIGAVAEGGERVLNYGRIRRLLISSEELEAATCFAVMSRAVRGCGQVRTARPPLTPGWSL